MNVKESLTKKLGPLPAWAWLLLLAAVLYYYRKFRGTSAAVATGIAPDPTPVSRDPVVLQPGESVYDPNTGTLVGGTGSPGGSGSGTPDGSSVGGSGDATPAADNPGGSDGQGTTAPPPSKSPKKPRRQKRVKLNAKGLARAGSSLQGAKRLSKPRSSVHTRGARKQKAAGSSWSVLSKPRPPAHPTVNKRVKPPTKPTRTRVGRSAPMVQRTEHQRPVAQGPAARRPVQAFPHQAPPSRAVAHNPGRTVHAGSPPRVARPRGRKK